MANGKAQPAPGNNSGWRKHLLLAIFAAVLVVMLENWFFGRTLWQRVSTIEQQVQHIEQELQPH